MQCGGGGGREGSHGCVRGRGQAGRQADRGEGVQKDKARGENVAGFKGCRLAWPRRSHEV